MKKLIAVCVAVFTCISLFAIKDDVNYEYNMENYVLPYFGFDNVKTFKKEKLKTFQGVSFEKGDKSYPMDIKYAILGASNEKAKYHIVIIHGLNETFIKYAELMYDLERLTDNQIRFYVMDQRGYGFSSKFHIKNPEADYMDKFDNSIHDIKNFMDNVVRHDVVSGKPVYLFAHSMGGGVCARFLEKYNNKGYFDKVILHSPMIAPVFGVLASNALGPISRIMVSLGKGEDYMIGEGPYEFHTLSDIKAKSRKSNSENRFDFFAKLYGSDKKKPIDDLDGLYHENRRCGVTWHWLLMACRLADATIADALIGKVDDKPQIQIFQAEKDGLVNVQTQNLFKALVKNCSIVRFKNIDPKYQSRHEMYMGVDSIRGNGVDEPNLKHPVTVIDHIMSFFEMKYEPAEGKTI